MFELGEENTGIDEQFFALAVFVLDHVAAVGITANEEGLLVIGQGAFVNQVGADKLEDVAFIDVNPFDDPVVLQGAEGLANPVGAAPFIDGGGLGVAAGRERRKAVVGVEIGRADEVMEEVAKEYPEVEVINCLVDSAATALCLKPTQFDVMVMENMFGDILSDEGSVLAGSIGMLPSASIGDAKRPGVWAGLYEPVHGSAPDIAGQNKANPLGAIGSVAAMLEYSFGLIKEASAVNAAIEKVLNSGKVTADLKPAGKPASTEDVGHAVCEIL